MLHQGGGGSLSVNKKLYLQRHLQSSGNLWLSVRQLHPKSQQGSPALETQGYCGHRSQLHPRNTPTMLIALIRSLASRGKHLMANKCTTGGYS